MIAAAISSARSGASGRGVDGVLLAAVMTGLGVWIGESDGRGPRVILGVVLAVGSAVHAVGSRRSQAYRAQTLIVLALFVGGVVRSDHEWTEVAHVTVGPYVGEAVLRSDPRPKGRGVHVVLEIERQRFDVWAYGPSRTRLGRYRAGEVVIVEGERRHVESGSRRRRQIRHVMGRFDLDSMMTVSNGSLSRASPLVLAAHRVRTTLSHGARTLSTNDSALFAGLVYGDDTAQPAEMIDRFRRSGLAHLTAVSGQNVAYILTMAAPVLTRLRRSTRLALTLAILGWFAILTRHEASVIRASMMAAVSASVLSIGRQASGGQILGGAAIGSLLVDPFLAWSVGWWLSMSGAAGLIFLTPVIADLWARRRTSEESGWVSRWLSPMGAAQMGVLPVSVLVFGVPSAWAIPCNLLAVPMAGVVMLVGLPVALVAGFVPDRVAGPVMWPLGVGVRWVDTVAALGARLDVPVFIDYMVAAFLFATVLVAMWYHHRERRVPT